VPITRIPDPRNHLSGPWNLYPPHTTRRADPRRYVLTDEWKLLAETGRSDADRSRYTVRIGNYNIGHGRGAS
jgi:iron complex outermembrane receptor protein